MRFYRVKVGVFDAKCRALKGARRVAKLFTRPVEPAYVFVLSPPYCGSTLMHQVLSTSPNVTPNNLFGTREGQALPEVRALIDYRRRWDETYTYPWPAIKAVWTAYWAHHKPLRLDKSPPNLIRTAALTRHFSPAHFICITRSPHAHCESLMRRDGQSAREAALFSLRCLRRQKQNLDTLPHACLVRYEDLVADPAHVRHCLLDFLPALDSLDVQRTFNANDRLKKPIAITDRNSGKWARLPEVQQRAIITVLQEDPDVLAHFGYGVEVYPASVKPTSP